MDTIKIQFELPIDKVKDIEASMLLTGIATRKDYFNNALTLFDWAIRESMAGNIIASVDENNKKFKELVMPPLNRAKGTK